MPRLQRGKRILLRTLERLMGMDSQQSQRGTLLRHLCQPPSPLGKKSSGIFSATPEDTISPRLFSGLLQPSLQMLCNPSSRREIRAALTTLSTLPSSCWTGTSRGSVARKFKTNGRPWSPPTTPPTPSATGPSCASWAARDQVPLSNISIAFEGKTLFSSSTAQGPDGLTVLHCVSVR